MLLTRGYGSSCNFKLISSVFCARNYAFSRFPERRPGIGRGTNRKWEARKDRPLLKNDEEPASSESPSLWQESFRSPVEHRKERLSKLLSNETLVVTRQIEMLNIFVGFEQANKYVITAESEEPLGYIAEEPRGILSTFSRQLFRTHRPFRAIIMDIEGSPVLWLRRPFSWINSRMFVQRLNDSQDTTTGGEPIRDSFAEVQQQWHIWRRKYDLFLREDPRTVLSVASEPQPKPDLESFRQFARIDEGLFAWDFTLRDRYGAELASVDRTFRGFGREIFTDTGRYVIRFSPRPSQDDLGLITKPTVIHDLTLEERALVLATAVNIDFDYFSRHSDGHGFGIMHMFSGGE